MKNIILVHGYNGIPPIFSYFKVELEKREYNENVSYILRKEWLTKDGILEESKSISKKDFDFILRNNFLSEIKEQEILNIKI